MDLARSIALQILFIAPLFWLFELVQNQFFRVVINRGEYGWYYPDSPFPDKWFSFWSLLLWASAAATFGLLQHFFFDPRGTPWWTRALIAGPIGWTGELATGLLSTQVFKRPFLVWNQSKLGLVRPIALPFWMSMVVLHQVLSHPISRGWR